MYTGPYLVIKAIAPVNYVIQKSSRSKVIVVHADKLKRCFSVTPESWLQNGHVEQSEQKQIECPSKMSNDSVEIEREQNNTQLNLLNDDYQENKLIQRNKRKNRRIPKRFEDYRM